MNRAVTALRWTVAVVLGAQAAILGLETVRARPLQTHHLIVAAAELVGALLLLVPASRGGGAALLAMTLAGVAILELTSGKAPPWSFAVYGMSMFVVGRFAASNADLFDRETGALSTLYDPDTLRSERARRVFVLPTVAGRKREAPLSTR